MTLGWAGGNGSMASRRGRKAVFFGRHCWPWRGLTKNTTGEGKEQRANMYKSCGVQRMRGGYQIGDRGKKNLKKRRLGQYQVRSPLIGVA